MIRRRLVLLLVACIWLSITASVVVFIIGVQAWARYQSTTYDFAGNGFVTEDSRIGYAGMPNAELHHLATPVYDVFTDDRGGRAGRPGEQAPKRVDFLFIGDSFTWGDGIEDVDTYPKIFARRLGISVFNAAEPSYGNVAMLLSIDRFSDMSPRYIVVGFLTDQLWRNFSPCAAGGIFLCLPMAYLDGDWDHLTIHPPVGTANPYVTYMRYMFFPHRFGWHDVYWSAYRNVYMTLANQRRPQNHPGAFWPAEGDAAKYFERGNDPAWRGHGLRILVERMAAKSSQLGAKLVFLNIPSDPALTPPPPEVEQSIDDLRQAGELVYADAGPAMRAAAAAHGIDHIRIPANGHPTPAASEIIAEILAAAVSQADGSSVAHH